MGISPFAAGLLLGALALTETERVQVQSDRGRLNLPDCDRSWHGLPRSPEKRCDRGFFAERKEGVFPPSHNFNRELFKRTGASLVREGGLEPPRCYPLAPQASASTNSAIRALIVRRDGLGGFG